MKVTIDLNDDVIYGIAYSNAVKAAYDWFESTGNVPDATSLYASAFEDGMRCVLNFIKEQNNEKSL